jgi:two-component system NtrC family sensor kinase
VLLNLLMNAGDAMDHGGTVTVTTDTIGQSARVRVADTGPGIPPEVLGKIFNPFFTTKPTGKGTGLGLSVSYGIVKDHKGDISARSEKGKGTTFTILIPFAADEVKSVSETAPAGDKKARVISLR